MSQGSFEPYLPRLVVDWNREQRSGGVCELDGTLVSVDISGFTRLSERLQAKGRAGAPRAPAAKRGRGGLSPWAARGRGGRRRGGGSVRGREGAASCAGGRRAGGPPSRRASLRSEPGRSRRRTPASRCARTSCSSP